MKYILSPKQMQEIEQYTFEGGSNDLMLMENAGTQIYSIIAKRFDSSNKVLIVAGGGGNGGDAFVVARLLAEHCYNVEVLFFPKTTSFNCLVQKQKYLGKMVNDINDDYDVIVDGLLGIGINSKLNNEYCELIEKINHFNKPFVISIDISSGINSQNGISLGAHINSDLTIAIQNTKYGHYLNDGLDSYKELSIIDINCIYPKDYLLSTVKIFEKNDYKHFFKKRLNNSHKGSYGRVAIIAGSKEYIGASVVSANAMASLLVGSGYATMAIPRSLYNIYALKNLETTYFLLDDNDGNIVCNSEEILKLLNNDIIVIGMGLGVSEQIYEILKIILKNYDKRLIIDADALNALAIYGLDILKDKKCEVIITPHIKEFSRLTKKNVEAVMNDGITLSKIFADEYNVCVVLKSSTTIISYQEEVYFNVVGTPALAKAGSGDVLAGILGGIWSSQNLTPISTAILATYILGRSGELAAADKTEYCVLSSDIISQIPEVIKEIC